jgi:hypothetical protein
MYTVGASLLCFLLHHRDLYATVSKAGTGWTIPTGESKWQMFSHRLIADRRTVRGMVSGVAACSWALTTALCTAAYQAFRHAARDHAWQPALKQCDIFAGYWLGSSCKAEGTYLPM